MAVQTLHLKRHEHEMNPPGFGVLDGSSIFLSNIGGHDARKKRSREVGGNQFLIQSQPSIPRPQKMIRQQNHPPALVSTGLQLAFGEQKNLGHNVNNNNNRINPVLLPSIFSSSPLSEDFAGPVNQYSKELDQLLQAQGEQMRQALAERQQAHCKQLILTAEKSASQALKKKQTELDRLFRRSLELENQLARLQTQALEWQSRAIASQATASSIHAQIQQVMAAAGAAAMAGGGKRGESLVEDAGSACIDPNWESQDGKLLCRACRNQAVSVVVLPCRHLCLCEDCDIADAAKTCPVCDCAGSGSVRVFLC